MIQKDVTFSKNRVSLADVELIGGSARKTSPGRWLRRYLRPWGMLLTLSGSGAIRLGEAEAPLTEHTLAVYRPGHPHEFATPGPWEYIWFQFPLREHLAGMLNFEEVLPGLGVFTLGESEFHRIRTLLEFACDEEQGRPPNWRPALLALLEAALLLAVNTRPGENRIRRAAELLSRPQCRGVAEVAHACGMSESLLYSLFRREFGCPPWVFREQTLLRRGGALLLNSEMSLDEIAGELGMCDGYYFSNRFKKFTGLSPRLYRRRNGVTD